MGIEVEIPRGAIRRVEHDGSRTVTITWGEDGVERRVLLYLRRPKEFLAVVPMA
jgi:hypothetical protein